MGLTSNEISAYLIECVLGNLWELGSSGIITIKLLM